jgi:hypothetical protein
MAGSSAFSTRQWRIAASDTADHWFEALDSRCIDGRGEHWFVRVLGIHADGADLWIQVAAAGHPDECLVLHITPSVTLDDVLRTLRARLDDLALRHVIHVLPAA